MYLEADTKEHLYFVIYDINCNHLDDVKNVLDGFICHEKLLDNFYIVRATSCDDIEKSIYKYFKGSEFGYFIERIGYNFCTNLKNDESLLLRLRNNFRYDKFKCTRNK